MKPSEHDGQSVLVVDALHFQHSGLIVGQTDDERWLYVQSDRADMPEREWHFKVTRDQLAGVLEASL